MLWLSVVTTFAAVLIAPTARADAQADLRLQVSGYRQKVSPGAWATSTIDVINDGPDLAEEVVLTISPDPRMQLAWTTGTGATSCSGDKTLITCRMTPLRKGEHASVQLTEVVPFDPVALSTALDVTSDTADPDPANNHLLKTIEVSAAPDLSLLLSKSSNPYGVDPGQEFSASFVLTNHSATTAHDVVVLIETTRVTFEEGDNGDFTCTRTATGARCTLPPLDYSGRPVLKFSVRVDPPDEGGPFRIGLVAGAGEPELDPSDNHWELLGSVTRLLPVISTADSGAGSLRQTILDATALCGNSRPCKIVFRLAEPLPAGGWYTIRPRTELPKLAVYGLILDASTQTSFGGDTNPAGPEVELSGELLAGVGNGLVAGGSCYTEVRGLGITNFPENGILAVDDNPCNASVIVDGNTIGVSPDGRRAAPNQRGIRMAGHLGVYAHDNVISGNLRSGIFIGSGGYSTIERNRIGLLADGSPMPNGASGIYVGADSAWTHMNANTIAYHQDFGIAIAPGARTTFRMNEVFGNHTFAIDQNLDYETADSEDDTGRTPNRPRLTVATYDAATGKTHVEGTLHMHCNPCDSSVDLFASDGLAPNGTAQAQRFVAEMKGVPGAGNDFFLQLDLAGDLRGQFLTATATRLLHFDGFSLSATATAAATAQSDPGLMPGTSELSPAIEVR